MNVASLLTLLRLVLVPVLLVLAWLHAREAYFWTLLAALATDAVDGFLAAAWGWRRPWGPNWTATLTWRCSSPFPPVSGSCFRSGWRTTP